MRTTLFFLILALGHGLCMAQKASERMPWHASVSASLVNGGSGASGQVMVSAEASVTENWSLGASSGFDYYGFRSVPLSLDARRYLTQGPRRLFAHASAGANIAWPTDSEKTYYTWRGEATESRFRSGIHTDAGIGYLLTNRMGRSFFLSASYSIKSMGQTRTESVWNGTGTSEEVRETSYTFHRILLRIGYRF
jgi:hypothetical protein